MFGEEQADQRVVVNGVGEEEVKLASQSGAAPLIFFGSESALEARLARQIESLAVEQAEIAERAGAVAVMALERIPADIRASGQVARMSNPRMIQEIQKAVSIPVMAKCRIGHFAEAQILESLGVDYIDESEVLTPADEANHIDKWPVARRVRSVRTSSSLSDAATACFNPS